MTDRTGRLRRHRPGPDPGRPGGGRAVPLYTAHRLNALCDGVFAIAMTLLALEVRVPQPAGRQEFRDRLPEFFVELSVYALAFFIIGQYWQSHHRVMKYVQQVDRRAVRWTIALLASVAALPITVELITHDAQFPEAVVVAAALLTLTSLLNLSLQLALLRPELSEITRATRRMLLLRSGVTAVIFAAAAPLAYLLPRSSSAPLVWWALVLTGTLVRGLDRLVERAGGTRARPSGPGDVRPGS
jgi:uncharacterized membrane protein